MKLLCVTLILLTFWQSNLARASTNSIDAGLLGYNLKTTAEAYDKVGVKDAKWDAVALKCLTLYANVRSLTNGSPDQMVSEIKTNVYQSITLGCKDTMIRYLYLRFVDQKTGYEAASAYGAIASALQKSEYPDIRKFYAAMWAWQFLAPSEKQSTNAAQLLANASSSLAKALVDKSMPMREAEQACDFMMSGPWWAEQTRWDCYHRIEPALTNGWNNASFALYAKGQAYISYGWAARGTGYADTVTTNGWTLLEDRLRTAAAALKQAWNLNPHDPRICREMIRVQLGLGEGRAQMEMWFRRGMKLDPGNHDVCLEKLEYLRPRWYGSIAEMIKFGRECTTNTNYFGSVRLMLVDAHWEASTEIQDNSERAAYWQKTNVWSDIKSTYEQYSRLYPDDLGYRQNYAFYAATCSQWQEFLNTIHTFTYTNFELFGGEERFNSTVRFASQRVKKQ